METKINLDDDLALNKTIGIYNVTIVVRAVFTKITQKFSYMNFCINFRSKPRH